MAFDTIIQQGSFTQGAAASNQTIVLRADVDWMEVVNYTNAGASGNDSVRFYWQRGMAQGTGLRFYKDGGGDNLNLTTLTNPNGFLFFDDSSVTVTTPANLITNISNAATPRVTLNAHGFQTGDIVRMSNITGAKQLENIDFHVTRVDANNFDLTYMAQVAAAAAPGASARAHKISREGVYQPKQRIITAITAANPAVITMAAPHDFTVGQRVKVFVPDVNGTAFGMVEFDEVEATVTAINAGNNTITVDVDASAFTAFSFALTADAPFNKPQVVPVGGDTATALSNSVDILADAVSNANQIYVVLPSGNDSPGGGNNDVMYWRAGRSFSVSN